MWFNSTYTKVNKGLKHINHELCKVLDIQSECKTLLYRPMYLVSMDVSQMSGGERKEPNQFVSCMQNEALVHKVAPSSQVLHDINGQKLPEPPSH